MDRMVLVAVALAMFGVMSAEALFRLQQMPKGASVWKNNNGLLDDIDFMDTKTTDFENYGRYARDALTELTGIEPDHVVSILRGRLPEYDIPPNLKLKSNKEGIPYVYHIFFTERHNLNGIHYLPLAITIDGRGFSQANPHFFRQKRWVMEATHHGLMKKNFDVVAEFWENLLRKKLFEPKFD